MKIKSYAGGGIVYTPYVSTGNAPTSAIPSGTTTSSSSGKTEKQDDEWKVKKMLEMIQKNGLISDVNVTIDNLKTFWTAAKNMSSNHLFGGEQTYDIMTTLFDIQKEVNANVVNYKNWETAQQNAYQKGALGEVAITPGGNIYVWTEQGITSVTPKEYSENRGTGVYYDYNGDGSDYLTNNEVLDIRNRYVSGNTALISNVGTAIGLNEIEEAIRTIVKDFGTESRAEYVKRTGNQISQSAWNGMQILLGQGPDGYYKVTTKSEREHVDAAMRHLWDVIGMPGKNKIIANVAAKGGDPTDPDEVFSIILDALQLHTDFTQDPSFEKSATEYDPDGDGKGGGKTEKLQLEDDPYLSVVAKGKGVREQISLTPSTTDPMGEQIGLKVWGINIGPLVDKNGNQIEQTSLPDALRRGEVFRGRPDNNVTFGNKVLTSEEQKTIVTDENAIVYLVELPYKDTINGIVPDFGMVDVYKKVNELLKGATNNLQRTEILIRNGIDPSKLTIDGEGNWTLKTKMFTRVPGYISEDLVELNDNNKRFMDPVDNAEGNQKRKLFNRILKFGNQQPGKDAEKVHSTWDWFGGGDWDRGDMHRGYFYVTAPDEWIAALLTNQNKIDKQLLTEIDKRIYMSRAQQDSPLITQLQ